LCCRHGFLQTLLLLQELEATRVKVQQLEAQQQQKETDLQRMQLDIQRAQQQRVTAKDEIERFTREAALTEKALKALNEQVAAARQQLNPLNHPKVRGFFKGQ
jgi:predicted  nucleic acid-binding Zn-ribbon protein